MSLKIPHTPNIYKVSTSSELNTKWHDGSLAWVEDESKLYVLDSGVFVSIVTVAGGGTMTTVKESGSQIGGSDIATLDFGAGFTILENPNTEINVTLDFSEVAGHDLFTDFVANEHIDWTNATSNLKTTGTITATSNTITGGTLTDGTASLASGALSGSTIDCGSA